MNLHEFKKYILKESYMKIVRYAFFHKQKHKF